MPVEIVMPRMGLTMESGTVTGWRKQEGQAVSAGEPLFEIETDKSTVEIEAPVSGVLGQVLVQVGETVPVGAVVGYLLKEGEKPSGNPEKVKASPAARTLAKRLGVDLRQVQGSGPGGRLVVWNINSAAHPASIEGPPLAWNIEKAARQAAGIEKAAPPAVKATPLAQRLAAEQGIDLSTVQGSGPGGRVTRQDLAQSQQGRSAIPADRPQAAPSAAERAGAGLQPQTRIQQVMAERMVESFTHAPHFYLHVEVDARPMTALRGLLLPKLEAQAGVHLTYTDLLIYFCARTLAKHPQVMAQWTPQGLRTTSQVHIAVAIDTESGLVAPVIRDASRLGLAEISRGRADLADRARLGKLLPGEFEEGVFTLTNLGAYRVDSFDAILNPPQAAILAVGRIKERALVENGAVVAAAMLTLSLSVDHRVLDGARAARFLSDLAEIIETPALAMV